jgi:predicted amidophosphoribosyltransferase
MIAKALARITHYKTQSIFLRTKNTVQVGSDQKTRLAQAEHAFILNPKVKIDPSATYVLFDDVWTTGASMNAATKKLRLAGASKIIIALLAVSRLD